MQAGFEHNTFLLRGDSANHCGFQKFIINEKSIMVEHFLQQLTLCNHAGVISVNTLAIICSYFKNMIHCLNKHFGDLDEFL